MIAELLFYVPKCQKCGDHLGLLAESACPKCRLIAEVSELRDWQKTNRSAISRASNAEFEVERLENLMRDIQAVTSDVAVVDITDKALCDLPDSGSQKEPLADRLEERGFTKREDRICGSPYCDKRFSPRHTTHIYCSVACEPPGPPSPPAGFSPRWGDDTEQPKLPNTAAEKGQDHGND